MHGCLKKDLTEDKRYIIQWHGSFSRTVFNLDIRTPTSFYTPPHFSVGVLCYTFRCLSVRASVRPCSPFQIDNLSIHHGIFSNFAYILLSGMSGMGFLMGKIHPFLKELLPFFVLEKWFLACYSFTVHDI